MKKPKAEFSAEMETSLREANEKLVIASVNAQVMTEAIERIMVHLSHMAEHDLLTNLPNRALLADRLVQSILLAKRHGSKLALMFLDIDHFKRINDQTHSGKMLALRKGEMCGLQAHGPEAVHVSGVSDCSEIEVAIGARNISSALVTS